MANNRAAEQETPEEYYAFSTFGFNKRAIDWLFTETEPENDEGEKQRPTGSRATCALALQGIGLVMCVDISKACAVAIQKSWKPPCTLPAWDEEQALADGDVIFNLRPYISQMAMSFMMSSGQYEQLTPEQQMLFNQVYAAFVDAKPGTLLQLNTARSILQFLDVDVDVILADAQGLIEQFGEERDVGVTDTPPDELPFDPYQWTGMEKATVKNYASFIKNLNKARIKCNKYASIALIAATQAAAVPHSLPQNIGSLSNGKATMTQVCNTVKGKSGTSQTLQKSTKANSGMTKSSVKSTYKLKKGAKKGKKATKIVKTTRRYRATHKKTKGAYEVTKTIAKEVVKAEGKQVVKTIEQQTIKQVRKVVQKQVMRQIRKEAVKVMQKNCTTFLIGIAVDCAQTFYEAKYGDESLDQKRKKRTAHCLTDIVNIMQKAYETWDAFCMRGTLPSNDNAARAWVVKRSRA